MRETPRILQPGRARPGPRFEAKPGMHPSPEGMVLEGPCVFVDSQGRVFLIPVGFVTDF